MKAFGRILVAVACLSAVTAEATTLGEIVNDRSSWPREVVISGAARATLLKNGKPAGMMLIGAGKTVLVTEITAAGVTGRVGADIVIVPIEKTDLLDRLGRSPKNAAAAAAPAADSRAPAASRADTGSGKRQTIIGRQLAGKLVKSSGGKLARVEDAQIEGVKYYALYYSASWCGPCRQFTPRLVQAYQKLKETNPAFEVVFVSADRSASDMAAYMRDDRMPWPAIDFDKIERTPELMRYAGPGIPCLVLVDSSGRVLSDSYEGDNYRGPDRVLGELPKILRSGG